MFLAAALAIALAVIPAPTSADWCWPTGVPVRVADSYEGPPVPWARGHRGVDLELAVGSAVRSAGAGTVIFAGMLAGRGVVSIQHSTGWRTTYEPVASVVRLGDRVEAGQVIGHLASGHCPAGCLHFGLKTGAKTYANPLSLFGSRVRLLPLR